MQRSSRRFRDIVGSPNSYLRRRRVQAALTVIGVVTVMIAMYSGAAQGQRILPAPECSTAPANLMGDSQSSFNRASLAVANVGKGSVQATLFIISSNDFVRAQQTFIIDPGFAVQLETDVFDFPHRGLVRILTAELSTERDFDTLLPTLTIRSQTFGETSVAGEAIVEVEHCHEV